MEGLPFRKFWKAFAWEKCQAKIDCFLNLWSKVGEKTLVWQIYQIETPFHKNVKRGEVGKDFSINLLKSHGRPLTEYSVSLDMAKEQTMVENNERQNRRTPFTLYLQSWGNAIHQGLTAFHDRRISGRHWSGVSSIVPANYVIHQTRSWKVVAGAYFTRKVFFLPPWTAMNIMTVHFQTHNFEAGLRQNYGKSHKTRYFRLPDPLLHSSTCRNFAVIYVWNQ